MPAPDQPRFNVGLALMAWLFAFTGGVLGAALITAATGYVGKKSGDLPLWLIAVQELPLWAGLLGASVVVSRTWGTGSFRKDFGVSFRRVDLWGIPVGVVTQLVFVYLLYKALSVVIDTKSLNDPARELTNKARDPVGVVLLALVIAVGAPIVEEIFFRGLVLRSIAARYSGTHVRPRALRAPPVPRAGALRTRGRLLRPADAPSRDGHPRPHGLQRRVPRRPARLATDPAGRVTSRTGPGDGTMERPVRRGSA
jgi:membrane protease YdiL (CAAX protease family)